MAEEENDDLILLEDEEEDIEEELSISEEEQHNTSTSKKSNIPLIIIISLSIIFLLIAGAYFLLQNDDDIVVEPDSNASTIIENIKKNESSPRDTTRLGLLTEKAKKLYQDGKKDEALKIYKQISLFHKSLASFNMGVAKLKDKKYQDAIFDFQNASKLDDLKFETALNIAVCYRYLKDIPNFKKYLKIAEEYVISKYNSPLFNYYLGLIEYYKDRPFESLIILRKDRTSYYEDNKNLLLAKEYSYIKSYDLSADAISKISDNDYLFTKGLLYAKNGEFALAEKSFRSSINSKKYIPESRMALALVQNKMSLFEDVASNLKILNSKYPKYTDTFPIKVKIKSSLHDPVFAQKEFTNRIFRDEKNRFGMIFYFAPYKLYDPKQSNTIIKKGAKEIYIDNISSAYEYLSQASSISEINLEIINGLKLLEKHRVYEANKVFKSMIQKYPNHSILHYDLALTYANIGDYKNAKKHFEKSYILDKKNRLSLFFSAMTDLLRDRDIDDKSLEKVMKYSDKKTQKELKLLYKIIKNDSAVDIDPDLKTNSFDMVLNIIGANMIGDSISGTKLSKAFKKNLANDLIANIIFIDQVNKNKSIKEYAKAIQENLTGTNIDLTPLIYGETFARELYVNILNIAGSVNILKNRLENELSTNTNQVALKLSLAYTYIFTKEYQKSYNMYNDIIDKYKVKDPHTLFLSSVSAIGSNHHANAIALLELANLDDEKQFESRYALGLLYHEAKNLEGAAIQYVKIGNIGFKSKYFDFDLKQ